MAKSIKLNETLTMTSVEIAELTGKLHKHVMRDIEKTLEELCQVSEGLCFQLRPEPRSYDNFSEYVKSFGGTYEHHTGMGYQSRPMYILPRMECDLVVSGYSVKYRAAIIKRWYELEAHVLELTQKDLELTQKNLELTRGELITSQNKLITSQNKLITSQEELKTSQDDIAHEQETIKILTYNDPLLSTVRALKVKLSDNRNAIRLQSRNNKKIVTAYKELYAKLYG